MKPYVSNFSYTASGGISQMRLGNGRWETAKFNERLQVTELGLGASATDQSVWKVAYGYGELESNGTVNAAKNTGNIAKQTISFSGLAQPFVQTFKYDSLYRITEAKETNGTATTANWTQSWSYDRYGNRLAFAQNVNGVTNNLTPSIDANTNRFTSGQGFVYDKNGNIKADVDATQTRSFVFDGDNKQTEILKNGNVIGRYFYDGEGKRVKKVTDLETTIFVYSSGKLVAEYSTQLAQTPSTNYTTTDHLGSPRVITNELGQIKSRRDFMPFGEDLAPDANNRTSSLKYNTDEVRQKFTGYQKDTETGLDFAEARMYNNAHGRFTAVDPLMASGKSANPQTFNRFIYVGNNPIISTDPSGLCKESDCPKNYYGTVYSRTAANGEVFYNNERPDDSWSVFTGNASFVRKSTNVQMVVNEFGWFESPVVQRDERVQALLGGFSSGVDEVKYGSAKGVGNVAIGIANGGINMYFQQQGRTVGIPQIPRYTYNTLREARFGTAIEACGMLCGGVAAAPFRAGSSLSVVPKNAVPNGQFYSVAFEMNLNPASYPGVSRYMHFKEANIALDAGMQTNPLLGKLGISIPRSASGSIIGKSPTNWVWHHNVDRGVMQLVPKSQHPSIPGGRFWEIMHPGGIGGYSIWGN
jgi:RHS repeat-associated protein